MPAIGQGSPLAAIGEVWPPLPQQWLKASRRADMAILPTRLKIGQVSVISTFIPVAQPALDALAHI